jgi:hypothetical protein
MTLEQCCKESLNSPLTVLAMLYKEYGSNAEHWRKNLDREVASIEQTTGMTSLALTDLDDQTWEEMEYERLIREAHTRSAWL